MAKLPEGTPRELPDEGSYPARIISFIDIGTQPASKEGWEDQRKAKLGLQLIGEKTTDNKNMCVYRDYTLSRGKNAHFPKVLSAIGLSLDADLAEIIDAACTVTIKHSADGQYANIDTITSPVKGQKVGKATEETTYLSLEVGEFDEEVFNELPGFIKEKIMISPEYEAIVEAKENGGKKKGASKKAAAPAKKAPAPKKKGRR